MNVYICVDFDGTCVDHRFPDIGPDAPYAVQTLRDLADNGYKLILWTMRSNMCNSNTLKDAVEWFNVRNINLYAVNHNPDQHVFSDSPKVFANIYIDDAALGAPLIHPDGFNRQCIDWLWVRKYFKL